MPTESLPAPLVPAEIDIAKLDGFMLDTRRVLSSELLALSSGDEFKAAVTLWCRAWQQRPAASLPNNPAILASFAGVTPQRWVKIKEMALRGFVLCSDGRLYHKVLAEDALRAWEALTKRHDRTKKATEARKKGRDGDRDDERHDAANEPRYDERHDQRDDARNDHRNEVPTVARDGTGRDGTGEKKKESLAGGGSRDAARPPPDGLGDGDSRADGPSADPGDGVLAIRSGVAAAFERWFDQPDRPFSPADDELFAAWVEAGTQRGLSPADSAAAAVEEVQRQFQRLEGKGASQPRSLRAVLDADVLTAIRAAKPVKPSAPGKPPAAVPPPFAGHFEPVEYAAWIAPCVVSVADGVARIVAPTRQHRDWVAQRLEPKLRAALGVDAVEVVAAAVAPRSAAA